MLVYLCVFYHYLQPLCHTLNRLCAYFSSSSQSPCTFCPGRHWRLAPEPTMSILPLNMTTYPSMEGLQRGQLKDSQWALMLWETGHEVGAAQWYGKLLDYKVLSSNT
jgi:hypothetical protein